MTKKIGKTNPRSESRASVIKHTIDLWSYLDAAHGTVKIIDSPIAAMFDVKEHEKVDDELQCRRIENMKVKWVLTRGFRFEETFTDGKAKLTKALVIVN